MNRQSRFDARYRMLGLVHWDDPEGWDGEGIDMIDPKAGKQPPWLQGPNIRSLNAFY